MRGVGGDVDKAKVFFPDDEPEEKRAILAPEGVQMQAGDEKHTLEAVKLRCQTVGAKKEQPAPKRKSVNIQG